MLRAPKRQARLEIAQHLLAEKLIKKIGKLGDGGLDSSEFDAWLQPCAEQPSANAAQSPSFQGADVNHDSVVATGELEAFLKRQILQGLLSIRIQGVVRAKLLPFVNGNRGNQSAAAQQVLKEALEAYWQNPGGGINAPPFNRDTPPGRNGTPPPTA